MTAFKIFHEIDIQELEDDINVFHYRDTEKIIKWQFIVESNEDKPSFYVMMEYEPKKELE